MFIYLSKKIAIPNGVQLHTIAWNQVDGWIVAGGANGLLKVLQLDSGVSTEGGGGPGSSALAMNQTLEGHTGNVIMSSWNNAHQKLTTTDQYGMIIVWILKDGIWHEEMINNRNQSVVKGMGWSSDGRQICIVYQDGAVIVGSVEGNRLWGKEFDKELTAVAWSPEGRTILFGTGQGCVQVHNAAGQYLTELQLTIANASRAWFIAAIEWYDGARGRISPDAPSLAIGCDNGWIQFMRNSSDPLYILINTKLSSLTAMKWSPYGSHLAVSGMTSTDSQFQISIFDPFGQKLSTLSVPGSSLPSFAWDRTALRLAIAADSFLYFATVRPSYRRAFIPPHTVIYSFQRPDRPEQCVMFWDVNMAEKRMKYVQNLVAITSSSKFCVLVTKADADDDYPESYVIILCSNIGSPIDSRYCDIKPDYIAMSDSYMIVADTSSIYSWVFSDKGSSTASSYIYAPVSGDERTVHVDDSASSSSTPYSHKRSSIRLSRSSKDPIVAITVSQDLLVVARSSGLIHQYSLPSLGLLQKINAVPNASIIRLNCTCTTLSVIDINGFLTLLDLNDAEGQGDPQSDRNVVRRKDTWDICWADDNPDLFVVMEKTRMYIYRGKQPEEPLFCSGYLCQFTDLIVTCVSLDDIMDDPHNPTKSHLVQVDTKSLRDTRTLLETVPINEVFQFISDNPHPRLWKLLAETALNNLDFIYADKAFIKAQDYQGIQLVKRLQKQIDSGMQRAEVAAYFRRFEEAEELYIKLGHKHAAVDLRIRLGDWFRVVQLLQSEESGNDQMLQQAADSIGDYYADRVKWDKALKYYMQSGNTGGAIEMAYHLEDYDCLYSIMMDLEDGSPFCARIADQFASVGLSAQAVQSYLKYGNVKGAIDCCVRLNEWSTAMQLAETHHFPEIEALLAQYAQHLIKKDDPFQAIELYGRAHRYHDSATLLKKQVDPALPLTAKKLHVCAALQLDLARKQIGNMDREEEREQVITSLLNQHVQSSSVSSSSESPWHAAEAYHFLMLAQRALYDKSFELAMVSALRLQHYEDVIDTKVIYSTIALASFHNQFYEQCSNAFMKLEMLEGASQGERDSYKSLAFSIFAINRPVDPPSREYRCPNQSCNTMVNDWNVSCPSCQTKFPGCVASGRSIFSSTSSYSCACCDHPILESEMSKCQHCPLCHAPN